ncbi:PocR ligand-binding domain-containing protein [Methanogenium organophilum]|uniref:PocR ligand-binding domain-containing protein n=1 Tax=Methanogenium organophilum TaxID=2199 RepID=A0A9X9S5K1_METOG|nr:PocR ligand-binding domain-containing protein [Methanogenium organophilum]WAI02534.1 PocR ligand-binding domain-containing protein [Methanogenium organophilum]
MNSILYVDDEEALLDIAKIFLERTGTFSVDTAGSASEGLELIQTQAYSAVVSDYEMPGMNGIEFLQEVRNHFPDLPFIIFTGRGREDVVIEALNSGASYYIQKGGDPVSQFAELTHKINLAVDKRKTEGQLWLDERRLEALVDFYEKSAMPVHDFMDYAIEEITRITASQYGYIAFVKEEEDLLSMYSWSQQAMKECRIAEHQKDYSVAGAGIWGDAVRNRQVSIINDFESTVRGRNKLPEGHVHLSRYLGVPVFDKEKIVLLAGVANKKTPYDEADVRQITLLMNGLWEIVTRKKTEDELKSAYAEMEAAYEELVASQDELVSMHEELQSSRDRLEVQVNYLLSPCSDIPEPELIDLISSDDLQRIQDAFAEACNVASMITDTGGKPITRLSNGCEVCTIIRSTEKGAGNCMISDRTLGKEAHELMKPTYAACRGIGFIDASAPICVGGRHIANWLIGQSNPMGVTKEQVIRYAREIDADENALVTAFERMETMSLDTFEKILHLLWIVAGQLSTLAYTNVRLAKDAREAHLGEGESKNGKE